jgi:four helix bundle protein
MQPTSNLAVSRKARQLAVEVYRACNALPASERYGLASQMRRAAVSVGSNIAEGCGREGDRALAHFLQIAMGSASELEFQLQLSVDLELVPPHVVLTSLQEVGHTKRMLGKLIASLRRSVARAERNPAARATDRLKD